VEARVQIRLGTDCGGGVVTIKVLKVCKRLAMHICGFQLALVENPDVAQSSSE